MWFSSKRDRLGGYGHVHKHADGWFSWHAAAIWDFLLRHQRASGIRGDLLELGVFHGKSGAMLSMAAAEGETAILVDIVDRTEELKRTLSHAPKHAQDATQFVKCDSQELLGRPEVEGRTFRWIHIDTEHTAPALRADLDLAHQVLTDDGVVCLDDIFLWLYPQLTDEMYRYVRAHPDRFSLFLVGYNKAFLARPGQMHAYMEACHKGLIDELEQVGIRSCLARTARIGEYQGFGIGPRAAHPRHHGLRHNRDQFEY